MKGKPLYKEIYENILEKITDGQFSENAPLPSERDLCDLYLVSRSTIRQALNLLQRDNYIYKIQGQGTFIKPQIFEQTLYKFYSFTEELKKDNIELNNTIITCEEIALDETLAINLNKNPNEIFHKIVRLRSAKNYPLMLEITYLPKSRFYNINTDILTKQSLYTYLKTKYSLTLNKAVETFKPIIPCSLECSLLNITSKIPCMLLERFSYEDNSIVEYTQSIIRGDKYVFKVILNK